MPQRQYEAEAENRLPEGFEPDGDPLVAQADDLIPEGFSFDEPIVANEITELGELMAKAAYVLEMVGGVFTVMAVRKQIAPGMWVPERYVAKWESYAPGIRQERSKPKAEAKAERPPEPKPEPEEEELTPEEMDDHFPEAEAVAAGSPLDGLVSEAE